MSFKSNLSLADFNIIVKATELVSGWIETQSNVTHKSLNKYTNIHFPSITSGNCDAILKNLVDMKFLFPSTTTDTGDIQFKPEMKQFFHRKLSKLRIKNCILEIRKKKSIFKRGEVVDEMVNKFSSIAMELIYDLLKLLHLEGIIVARNSRFTEFEFPVGAAVTGRKRSSSSRAETEIEPPHQPAKRRNRQTSKAPTTTTAALPTTTTTISTLPVEIIVIDDDEDDGKEISLPSSSMGEVEEEKEIAEESILAPITMAATEIITTSSRTTTTASASQSSTAAFFSPAPTTTTAAVVTMPIHTSTSTTTAFSLDDLYQILIAAFARSKGEVPLKEVLLTAREQWPTLSEVALGKLVAVAEEMNKVMFFEDKIYEI